MPDQLFDCDITYVPEFDSYHISHATHVESQVKAALALQSNLFEYIFIIGLLLLEFPVQHWNGLGSLKTLEDSIESGTAKGTGSFSLSFITSLYE